MYFISYGRYLFTWPKWPAAGIQPLHESIVAARRQLKSEAIQAAGYSCCIPAVQSERERPVLLQLILWMDGCFQSGAFLGRQGVAAVEAVHYTAGAWYWYCLVRSTSFLLPPSRWSPSRKHRWLTERKNGTVRQKLKWTYDQWEVSSLDLFVHQATPDVLSANNQDINTLLYK